ncbi:MAG: 4'-phosphopantetheinyl transferase family protein [Chitinophagales bacterium]
MRTEQLQWCTKIPGELINSNGVHVWRAFLDVSTDEFERLSRFLSADELARARRFHFESDQKRFIIARGILRKILGRYLGWSPDKLRFEYTSHGKPMLATDAGNDNLCFNLSHSAAFALYAVTYNKKIGIDIERLRDDVALGQIAQNFFSQGEINSLEKINKNKRAGLFFQYWTRKEAFVKAMGEGISFPMNQCDVSLLNGNFLSPVILSGENSESSCLHVQDLFPGDGYAAAIATEGGDLDISWWHYSL